MFFVASLPRTRTYWLSQYFSSLPGVRCYHELLNGLATRQQFYDAMERDTDEITGNADCGLYITDFHTRWPDAPVLIVDRAVEDVHASLAACLPRWGYEVPAVAQLEEQRAALASVTAMHVPFNRLDEYLPEVHEYLGLPAYDPVNATIMSQQNLQMPDLVASVDSFRLWAA